MATLYYDNATENGNWATLGNWRLDNFTGTRVPATSLPTSSDSVVVKAAVTSNTGTQPTVVDLQLELLGGETWAIAITVTGLATLTGDSANNSSAVEGGAAFYGNVVSDGLQIFYCTISGNLTLSNAVSGDTNIGGNATFSGAEYFSGVIGGSATFNSSSMGGGTVSGDAVFENNAYMTYGAIVEGSATFSGGSYSDAGIVYGNAVFTDSNNYGEVAGDAEFIRSSNADNYTNQGYVGGDAVFRGYGEYYNHYNCTVAGNAEFYDGTYNYGGVGGNATFNDYSFNNEYVGGNATFNDFSRAAYGTIGGTATFNDYSYMEYPMSGTVVLDNSARITASATGTTALIEFRGNSYNVNGISGTLTVAHGGCINGSSILGVV